MKKAVLLLLLISIPIFLIWCETNNSSEEKINEFNSATLIENIDWSKTLTYSGNTYILSWYDLDWYYYWWFNQNTENLEWNDNNSTIWREYDNVWWWSEDTLENWYDSWNPRNERQWPCPSWWHVPSRWEWNGVLIAWCHLPDNDCSEDDLLNAPDDEDGKYGMIYITYLSSRKFKWILEKFSSDLNMDSWYYWSSSPDYGYYYDNAFFRGSDSSVRWIVVWGYINPGVVGRRSDKWQIRCFKDSIE